MSRTDAVKWLKAVVYAGIYGGLLVPLVFVPVVIFPFVFSKLIYFQILIELTFPAYLILAWVEPRYRPRWVPLYSAIVAYFIALALSVAFAVDIQRAWWGNQERMNGLFTVLHFLAWLTMAFSLLTTWKQWKRILWFEVALSAVMAVVALLQKPFPRLLMFTASDRVGGLLDNPIYMAGYQIFNLFFIALLWLKGASKKEKLWLVAFALLDVGAFIAAQSRGALLGLFAGLAVFAVAYAAMSPGKKTKAAVVGLALAAFVSYGALYALRDTAVIKTSPLGRLTNFQVTTETRFIAWKIAWQGFLERPLTGWGFDDFHLIFNQKYNPKSLEFGYYETWFDRAHNTVLDMLAMTGIFGFITFFGIFGALFYSVFRAYRKKWIDAPVASVFIALPIGYFVQNLFVFDQPAGFTMSFFMYALIANATAAQFTGVKDEDAKAAPAHAGTRPVPWTALAVIELVALFLVWRYSVLPWRASYNTIKSNNYFSAGNLPEAYRLAKKAASYPTPYLDEQTFLQSRNLMTLVENGSIQKFPEWRAWHDLIVSVTDQHIALHPRNTHPHFIYARFLNSFARIVPEDGPLAEREYLKAIETSPRRQQLLYSIARFYNEVGKKQEGYDYFKQALDLNPNVGESHWYVGVSLIYDLGRMEEGARELVSAMTAKAPYQLKEVREAVAVARAYEILKDTDGFIKLLSLLPTMPGGSIPTYLEIARSAERLGLIDQRNLLLGAISRLEPSLVPRLLPLQDGSATSIEASFRMTENATPPTVTPESTTTSAAPVATTSVPNGSGLRRK